MQGVQVVHAPGYLLAFIELFSLCHLWLAGGLLPLGLVVGLSGGFWLCLSLGLLVVPPAHRTLSCRSLGELIPPRSYLCLINDPGSHTRIGLVSSSGVRVLGVAVTNNATQWPV